MPLDTRLHSFLTCMKPKRKLHGLLQLTAEGLLPFNKDMQTAFGLAVLYAFPQATSLYAINVSSVTVGTAAPNNRLVGMRRVFLVVSW
jgi:hypothetical protein